MSTVDTSTWSPDTEQNISIEGVPLNADAGIAQTWQALRVLMAAVKGDGDAIKAMIDVMQGATASADGASGLVPAPEAGDQDKFLKGDGTWGTATASSVAWADVTGKPSTFTPSSHAHGNITNNGKLDTASRAVVTDGNKTIDVSSVTATELGCLSGVTDAVQTQLNAKAVDSAVVHVSGNENIGGKKTFTESIDISCTYPDIIMKASGRDRDSSPSSNVSYQQKFQDKNGKDLLWVQVFHRTSGQTEARLCLWPIGSSASWQTLGLYYPFGGNPYGACPTPDSYNYNDTKIATTAWVTGKIAASSSASDRRKKTSIRSIPDDVLDAWADVDFQRFKYLEAVAEKGERARFHVGVIAQDVIAAFERHGCDAADYGLLCLVKQERASHWEDVFGEDGRIVESREVVDREAEEYWGIRYDEALVLECALMRRRSDALEARIRALEEARNG